MSLIIHDLEKLLSGALPLDTTIKKYSTKNLVEPGENAGSFLYGVTVEIENNLKSVSELNLVAKVIPKNEWLKKQFNTQVTFKREIAMYDTIGPELQNFQVEQGSSELSSFLPKCYASRINLNAESTLVDNDAIILLEDLTVSGFVGVKRREGFNFEATQIILRNLAALHATTVAFRIVKPDAFRRIILPHLSCLNLFDVPEDVKRSVINNICNIAKSSEECIGLTSNIRDAFELWEKYKSNRPPPKEPFATIIHSDLWVNNIMIKLTDDTPVNCKLLDFQTMQYGSPCQDLVFFLYTSVKAGVLKGHFSYLRDYYFRMFINTLEALKCDITPFKYDLFVQEFEDMAKIEFGHIIVMLNPVLNLKKAPPANDGDITNEECYSDEYKKRLPEIVLEFSQKGWI